MQYREVAGDEWGPSRTLRYREHSPKRGVGVSYRELLVISRSPRFCEPPWEEELDLGRALAAVTPDASIAGMFFLGVLEGAKRRNLTVAGARERYLPFGFYPLAEFMPLLVAACAVFYPRLPLRQALRAIGAVGPAVLAKSVLGKVTLGSAVGVHAVIEAVVKTYPLNIRPIECSIVQRGEQACVVRLGNVQHFLDSHHVGVFEGTMKHAGVSGKVLIESQSAVSADLWLEW